MANRFSLDAVIRPTVDDQAVDREVSDMERQFQDGIGDLDPGVEGLGGARATGAAGGGGVGAAGAAGGAGILSKLGGTATKAAMPVALAGATGFGILQGTQRLAQASPALQQTLGLFGEAMGLFFRPFGNALSDIFRPAAEAAITAGTWFADHGGAIIDALELFGSPARLGAEIGREIFGGGTSNELVDSVLGDWPGWPDAITQFPGWPNVVKGWQMVGGWPNVGQFWNNLGGWPNVGGLWNSMGGWPDLSLPTDFWPTVEWPGWGEIIDIVQGGGGDGGGGGGGTNGGDGGVDFTPGSGEGRGPDYVGSGPERGRGAVSPNDPRLASNQVGELSAEELRRSRRANEQVVDLLKQAVSGQGQTESLDPFMSR